MMRKSVAVSNGSERFLGDASGKAQLRLSDARPTLLLISTRS